MLNSSVKTKDLFDCKTDYLIPLFEECEYPWEMLPKIKDYIEKIIGKGLFGFKEIEKGVWIGENVTVSKTAVIQGPAIIGKGTEIRPGAYLRGNIITGEKCVIGNSTELKNCILLDNVQVPHYNYIGDSVLGNYAHMGAGSICSNLKADGKPVVIHGEKEYETGLRKVGGFLGDHADVGCSCVLNPGTIIGQYTRVYPLNSLRGVFPDRTIVKSMDNIVAQRPKI